jgi:hypothetical protein
MKIENRSAYLLNDGLQIIDTVGQSLPHLGGACARDSPLQRKADGEQSLDYVVVQITGNAVTVGENVQFAHPTLGGRRLPRPSAA